MRTTVLLFAFFTALSLSAQNPCDSTYAISFDALDDGGGLFGFDGSDIWGSYVHIWDFGDGSAPGTGPLTYHQYNSPGTYQVCLEVAILFGNDSCWRSTCEWLTVGGSVCDSIPLEAGFSSETDGNWVFLTDESNTSGYDATYVWDFGDGWGSSSTADPIYQYAQPGTYEVCLETSIGPNNGQDSCFSYHCETITVGPTSGCDSTFFTAFAAIDQGGGELLVTATSSLNPNGYIWDFGDGTTSTNGPTEIHTYADPGGYQVCLEAWYYDQNSQDTCWAFTCQWVSVGTANPCDSLFNAAFTWIDVPNVGVEFFNGTYTNGHPTNYVWEFGDGNYGYNEQEFHSYDQPGQYLVCLSAWYWNQQTQDSCWSEQCSWINVSGSNQPCDSTFAVDFAPVSQGGGYMTFTASGNLPVNDFIWNFGDGSPSIPGGSFTQHFYADPGSYYVCVTGWYFNQNGLDTCTADYCEWITIGGNGNDCDSLFNAAFTWIDVPNVGVEFFNGTYTNGHPTNYVWEFGDGNYGYNEQEFHSYDQPGQYLVCLNAMYWNQQTQDSCWSEQCSWITVSGSNDPCDSLLEAAFNPVFVQGTSYTFNNTTWSADPNGTQYFWDFGDGTWDNTPSPNHVFPGAGTYEVCLTAWTGICADTICTLLTIPGNAPCDSTFSVDFTPVTQGGGYMTFTASGNLPVSDFVWDFGDGSPTMHTGAFTQHFYEPGSYYVCVTGWYFNQNGLDTCMADHCEWITIGGSGNDCDSLFEAAFTWQHLGNGVVDFVNGSYTNGHPTTYIWSFGDGNISWGEDQIHTYLPGQYMVCLDAWYWNDQSQDSCFAQHCAWIWVDSNNPCDSIGLSAYFNTNQNGNVIDFVNLSTTGGYDPIYYWDFGDGESSSDENPTHDYQQPGVYTPCLYVEIGPNNGQDSCFSMYCGTVMIGGNSDCDSAFVAAFTWTSLGTQVVHFDNGTNTNGHQTNYLWDFGDGNTGYNEDETHTYAQSGQYLVCLNAWYWNQQTQDTCWSEQCSWVWVDGNTPCDSLLYADFYTIDLGGGSFAFNDLGYSAGVQTWYVWDFGDGSQGSDQYTQHTYTQSGTYWVCQTVNTVDQDGYQCTDSSCTWVNMDLGGQDCDSAFVANFLWQDVPGVGVEFFNETNTNGHQAYYVWDFGDGEMGYNEQEFHSYDQPGTYYVCLSAWYWNQQTQDTCWSEQCSWINVSGQNSGCDSTFTASFTGFDQGGQIMVFNATTSIPASGYFWSFGDGQTMYGGQFTQHYYQTPGTYYVCLEAWYYDQNSQDSCWTSTCEWMTIGGNADCDSTFSAYFTQESVDDYAVEFSNGTFSNGQPTYYLWDFGDGNGSGAEHPTHTFDQAGTYTVCLSAWYWNQQTQDTCWSTYCEVVESMLNTGVQDSDFSSENIQLFPNPGNGMVSISGLSALEETSLTVTDIRGRVVKSLVNGQLQGVQIDLNGLESGTYLFIFGKNSARKVMRYILE